MNPKMVGLTVFTFSLAVASLGGLTALFGQKPNQIKLNTGKVITIPKLTYAFNARPVDFILSRDDNFAYAKTDYGIQAIDLKTHKTEAYSVPGGTSQIGIGWVNRAGSHPKLAVTNAASAVVVYSVSGIHLKLERSVQIPSKFMSGASYPCGFATQPGLQNLIVCMSRDNCLANVNLANGAIQRYKTDPGPFAVTFIKGDHQALVSCLSASPAEHQATALSSGTEIPVDRRTVATNGALDLVDLNSRRVTKRVKVGLLPGKPLVIGNHVYVADANSDRIEEFSLPDLKRIRTWAISASNLFGASPNDLCETSSGNIAVACGGSNVVSVFTRSGHLVGNLETPDYPIAVRNRHGVLLVACTKGLGNSTGKPMYLRSDAKEDPVSDPVAKNPRQGYGVGDALGTLSILIPAKNLSQPSKALSTRQLTQGLPRAIKHVIYIIKENRTYDQVFGDMADGDPDLLNFGKQVTPNEHKLAQRFGLLARYFCDSVISTDGHAWSTEANSNAYLERSFGGWTRSYPWGDDPLAISSTGAIWDDALDHGKTFRNYGEYVYANLPAKTSFMDCFQAWKEGRSIPWTPKVQEKRLWAYSDHHFPGWNLTITDQFRADEFIRDYQSRIRAGITPPDLTVLYLEQNHTEGQAQGMPTPQAMNADNDYAVGRVVEAVSHSRYWKSTAIFITEDDPQDGYDHIDGHRSVGMVISPYSKIGAVNRSYYDQASLLHTIEALLNIPPMTRFDRTAPIMYDCFTTRPNFAAYTAVAPKIPLTLLNGAGHKTLSFDYPDESDDEALNHQIWASVYPDRPYPTRFCPPPDEDGDGD